MGDFLNQHLSEILSFIGGLAAGSFLTITIKRSHTAKDNSSVVDQSGATAGRDIVGGNSTTKK